MKSAKLRRKIYLCRWPGNGVGDNLFLTAVAREVKKCNPDSKVIAIAKYEELFWNNPHVDEFRRNISRVWRSRLRWGFRKLPLPFAHYQMNYHLSHGCEHIITQMCRQVLGPDYTPEISVDLFLKEHEIQQIRSLLPSGPYLTIHSAGKTDFSSNKEWSPDRFQVVVDGFSKLPFVQLGSLSDPALEGCKDLRGKLSLRQAVAALQLAELNVCQEGGLMHLAAASGTRSIVVYGGYIHPYMTGYSFNVNIVNQPECSPCWPASDCSYDHRCMRDISPEQVVRAIEDTI